MRWVTENFIDSDYLIIALSSFFTPEQQENEPARFDLYGLSKSTNFASLLIKDVNNCYYTRGIAGVSDTFDGVIAYLKEKCSRYKYTLFYGDSMAGYGALLYGSLIGATHIIATSPRIIIHPDRNKILEGDDKPHFLEERRDYLYEIRHHIERAKNTKITLIHSLNDRKDTLQANYLKDLSNVHVFGLPYADHWIARELKNFGILRRLLSATLVNIDFNVNDFIKDLNRFYESLVHDSAFIKDNLLHIALDNEKYFSIDRHNTKKNIWLTYDIYYPTHKKILSYKISMDMVYYTNISFSVPVLLEAYDHVLPDLIIKRDISFFEQPLSYENQSATRIGIEKKNIPLRILSSQSETTDSHRSRPDKTSAGNLIPREKMNISDNIENAYLFSGPYITLEAGTYVGTIKIAGTFSENTHIHLDVARDYGLPIFQKIYYARHLNRPTEEGTIEEREMSMSFFFPNMMHNIELRALIEGKFSGSVNEISLFRLEDE